MHKVEEAAAEHPAGGIGRKRRWVALGAGGLRADTASVKPISCRWAGATGKKQIACEKDNKAGSIGESGQSRKRRVSSTMRSGLCRELPRRAAGLQRRGRCGRARR